MAVLIGLYAARLGFSAAQIGVVLSSALWGAAFAALATLLVGMGALDGMRRGNRT
jgi:hypothetical protein